MPGPHQPLLQPSHFDEDDKSLNGKLELFESKFSYILTISPEEEFFWNSVSKTICGERQIGF